MSVEFFSNSQHHLWERCRMKESFFWENLVEREISRRTLWDVSSLPGRPREISFSLAGSTTAWAVCIFRPISGPNRDLKTSLRVLYFHERSNPDADSCVKDFIMLLPLFSIHFTWVQGVQCPYDVFRIHFICYVIRGKQFMQFVFEYILLMFIFRK